jgi:hypothetical protein
MAKGQLVAVAKVNLVKGRRGPSEIELFLSRLNEQTYIMRHRLDRFCMETAPPNRDGQILEMGFVSTCL